MKGWIGIMNFTIETINDNGSGMSYSTKEEFLAEVERMIDDCISNGGTYFDIQVDCDVSVFDNHTIVPGVTDDSKYGSRGIRYSE